MFCNFTPTKLQNFYNIGVLGAENFFKHQKQFLNTSPFELIDLMLLNHAMCIFILPNYFVLKDVFLLLIFSSNLPIPRLHCLSAFWLSIPHTVISHRNLNV